MHIAEFGSGKGFFALPMARIVGPDGMVYALDIQQEELDSVRSRARAEHILNMEPIRADLERPMGSKLKEGHVDFVLIANMLFQVSDKQGVLREAHRIIRAGGRAALIEWDMLLMSPGPPQEMRISKDTATFLFTSQKFELEREFEAGRNHYGLLFVKR